MANCWNPARVAWCRFLQSLQAGCFLLVPEFWDLKSCRDLPLGERIVYVDVHGISHRHTDLLQLFIRPFACNTSLPGTFMNRRHTLSGCVTAGAWSAPEPRLAYAPPRCTLGAMRRGAADSKKHQKTDVTHCSTQNWQILPNWVVLGQAFANDMANMAGGHSRFPSVTRRLGSPNLSQIR